MVLIQPKETFGWNVIIDTETVKQLYTFSPVSEKTLSHDPTQRT